MTKVFNLNSFPDEKNSDLSELITTQYHILTHQRYIDLENIVKKEKLLVTSNFSVSHNVFHPIWHLFFILNALLNVV